MPRKGFNWKARQVHSQVIINEKDETKVKINKQEIQINDEKFDETNAFLLPSKKRKTKIIKESENTTKPLTKKQRRNYEKIVEAKKKRANRADLLIKLESLQASSVQLAALISTSNMQTGKSLKSKDKFARTSEEINEPSNIIFNRATRKRKAEFEETVESSSSCDTSDMSSDEEALNAGNDLLPSADATLNSDINTNLNCENIVDGSVGPSASVEKLDAISGEKSSLNSASKITTCTKIVVTLNRPEDIEEKRQKLPVCQEEQAIMEAINENMVVIICGETGSGKTTQVPQFLYEAGYASKDKIIGITEPRRVAATCMANRVAYEMGLSQREVSYTIRYEGTATKDTKLKFMTDGVLLKEVQKDFELRNYSVIILDEAHERNVYTDILIGLLSRIVPLREKLGDPLKLIIMSATLRVKDFTENTRLFRIQPPVIKIDSRQFPVTVHFNKKTPFENYIGEAYNKVCKIHRKLPEGGILVFVTSQQEVHLLCHKLKNSFSLNQLQNECKKSNRKRRETNNSLNNNSLNKTESQKEILKLEAQSLKLDDFTAFPEDDDDVDFGDDFKDENDDNVDDDSVSDLEFSDQEENEKSTLKEPLYVLPLYSLLSNEKQAMVFKPIPTGCRLCVVATNVAETSITIPGIKYVVDTGKVKTKYYDSVTGVSTFRITNISQASANQRSGRAGRIAAGHCYRLYSSAVFSDFEKFSPPEITRKPVDDLVLQMKDIGIEKVVNFPFPTPPPIEALQKAEKLLYRLGALDLKTTAKYVNRKRVCINTYVLNDSGRTMARIPIAPRYARMLTLGHQRKLLPYVVALVAAMTVQEMFLDQITYEVSGEPKKNSSLQMLRKSWIGKGESELLGDASLYLKAICAFECETDQIKFCENYGIRHKAMLEARKLRRQLTNTLCSIIPNLDLCLDPRLSPPTDTQCRFLRQIMLSGLVDHVARKLPKVEGLTVEEQKKRRFAYEDIGLVDPVFIHPNSVLFKTKPEFIIYQTMEESSKLYMKGITAIELEWLPNFLPSDTHFSAPQFDDPLFQPTYDAKLGQLMYKATGTFGPQFWELPQMSAKLPNSIDSTRWFAKFLLEGVVFPKLKSLCPFLLSSPSIMIKSWAHLQSRTSCLLKSLIEEDVHDRKSLSDAWKENSNYLLKEYSQWLPENQQSSLIAIWPPLS